MGTVPSCRDASWFTAATVADLIGCYPSPKAGVHRGSTWSDGTLSGMIDFPLIRHEQTTDLDAIHSVNNSAFGHADEAILVETLRTEGAVLGSFVAEHVGQIVGHVLFSRTVIDTSGGPVLSVALAPLAVLPSHQRQGVGSELVRVGLEW